MAYPPPPPSPIYLLLCMARRVLISIMTFRVEHISCTSHSLVSLVESKVASPSYPFQSENDLGLFAD